MLLRTTGGQTIVGSSQLFRTVLNQTDVVFATDVNS